MLESFRELLSSSATIAAQRVRNPALGAFALSWCAFNWKSILYLLFSDSKIFDKIEFISAHSSWKTAFLFPCMSVIIICGILPWANNLISVWQAKPLDNNDSIENHRKAKQIIRSTRLRRLEAKRDVTYEKVKTGAEKDIQEMKEEIIKSKDSMGELTAELKAKDEELSYASSQLSDLNHSLKEVSETLERMNDAYTALIRDFDDYKLRNPEKSQLKSLALRNGNTVTAFLEKNGLSEASSREPKNSYPLFTLSGVPESKNKEND